MNRKEEYDQLLGQLEQIPDGLEGTLERAVKRQTKRRRWERLGGSLAACFCTFVLLVNFCMPVAYACSQVPVLRELAQAVTFSRSLSDAVKNQYVQPISLSQTDQGVTASVEYLIVDQKQVNVFYRLDSDVYNGLSADASVYLADGSFAPAVTGSNGFETEMGVLRSFCVDFIDEDVPECLLVELNIRSVGAAVVDETVGEPKADRGEEPEYLTKLKFRLDFDPAFTASGKVYPINQTVELGGQTVTITDMEVYPTHLRVNLEPEERNTAWLKDLDFYIETDWGMKFDPVANGITATGSEYSKDMISFRTDSTWFYEAKHLKLVITGATWLRKDMERVRVDLETGECGPLPEGVDFFEAKQTANRWEVSFRGTYRQAQHMHQLFGMEYYNEAGECFYINSWSNVFGTLPEEQQDTHFIERLYLEDDSDTVVWLSPAYSHTWTAENVIELPIR